MEEYMKLLMEQIRCKKAHPYIREEIEGHIEEQILENMRQGMSKEDAEKAAVEDMGSPVEVGISLDSIHKPQIAWGIIGLMAVISLVGIIIQQIISNRIEEYAPEGSEFIVHTILGFILMLIVYRVDYSNLARFSKIIAVLLLGAYAFAFISGWEINGRIYYIRIGDIPAISMVALMTLYVPLYGAVIYKYHGLGYKAFVKSIIWMLTPVFIAFRLPHLTLALILLISMSVVLTVAIVHDWFKVSKRKTIVGLWGCIFGVPLIFLGFSWKFGLLASYQIERIKSFLAIGESANYVNPTIAMVRTNLQKSQLFGGNGEGLEYFFDLNGSYVLAYISSVYGLILAAVLCGILAALIIKVFSISFRQKNQLGMCMGCGCGMILLLNLLLNIGINIGWIPLAQSFLPFFSRGGSNLIVCYILIGVILSIYRYKNIYPSNICTKLKTVKMLINL